MKSKYYRRKSEKPWQKHKRNKEKKYKKMEEL